MSILVLIQYSNPVFGFIYLLFILEVSAPKQTWAELTTPSSPEHKTNKDPPQIQKTQTTRSKELTSLPVLPPLFQASSQLQPCSEAA